VELIPSSGGVFEVERDGELIYSKKRTGRHAEWEEIRSALGGA
jgi:selenoprotein W-related protein